MARKQQTDTKNRRSVKAAVAASGFRLKAAFVAALLALVALAVMTGSALAEVEPAADAFATPSTEAPPVPASDDETPAFSPTKDTKELPPEPAPAAMSVPAPLLSFGRGILGSQSYTLNESITAKTLPAANATGEEEPTITYTLSPALPLGLSFDAAARTISGTPSEAVSAAYTYTASAEGYASASLTFTITVE